MSASDSELLPAQPLLRSEKGFPDGARHVLQCDISPQALVIVETMSSGYVQERSDNYAEKHLLDISGWATQKQPQTLVLLAMPHYTYAKTRLCQPQPQL